MNFQFVDRLIPVNDLYDYTDIEYVEHADEIVDSKEGDSIPIPLLSVGIDEIITYLHGIDPWNDPITDNHIEIVRYLGIKQMSWMIDEEDKSSYRVDVDHRSISIVNENGRECITYKCPYKILSSFEQDGYIYVQITDEEVGGHKAIHILNYRLEEIEDLKDIEGNLLCDIKFHYINFPTSSDKMFRWEHFIIDMKAMKRQNIPSPSSSGDGIFCIR